MWDGCGGDGVVAVATTVMLGSSGSSCGSGGDSRTTSSRGYYCE